MMNARNLTIMGLLAVLAGGLAAAESLEQAHDLAALGVAARGGDTVDRTFSCLVHGSGCPGRITDSDGDDDGVITAAIVVPSGACHDQDGPVDAAAVRVGARALHGNIGDLRITLLTPFGVRYEVLRRPAVPAGGAGSCTGDDLDAMFSDVLSAPPTCGAVIPALSGQVTSFTGLFSLAGPVQNGEWMLEVRDAAHGGDGLLEDWSLTFACLLDETLFMDGFE